MTKPALNLIRTRTTKGRFVKARVGKTILLLICCQSVTGCSVVSYDRVFPKLTWYWSKDAVEQRKAHEPPMITGETNNLPL